MSVAVPIVLRLSARKEVLNLNAMMPFCMVVLN